MLKNVRRGVSGRTYEHPFFEQGCPHMLKNLCRGVSSSGSNKDGIGTTRPKAASVPAAVVSAAGAAALAPPDFCTHTTVESDDGDLEDSKPPARKRTKVCGQRLSQATASDGKFPRLLHHLGDDTRVPLNAECMMQTVVSSIDSFFKMGMQAMQREAFSTPPYSPISSRVAMNADDVMQTERSSMGLQARTRQESSTPPSSPISPSRMAMNADHGMQTERSSMGMQARQRQAFSTAPSSPISSPRMAMNADHEFSAPWLHTGLWGGSTNSFNDRWTPIESPENRPLNVAIECEDGIPNLYLPPMRTIPAPQVNTPPNQVSGPHAPGLGR